MAKAIMPRRLGACIALAVLPLVLASAAHAAPPDRCADPPASDFVVNVKDKGAKGDGKTDDTVAIQAAIKAVSGTKGTVFIPNGTYLGETVGKTRLFLRSDMTLQLAPKATLKAKPNVSTQYAVLSIQAASNARVLGGTLLGDRDQHAGKEGEWGFGIAIGQGAKHVNIANVTATRMWGDGFYVADAKDVRFCSVVADGNRRQGLSIVNADGVLVLNSTFQNTHGTRPSAGIDLEPNSPEEKVTNIRIQSSKFLNNKGAGIAVNGKKGPITEVEMANNVFRDNYRPIVVENAPSIASAICGNRDVKAQAEISAGFGAFAEPVEAVVLQDDCGDTSFIVNRKKKKKK